MDSNTVKFDIDVTSAPEVPDIVVQKKPRKAKKIEVETVPESIEEMETLIEAIQEAEMDPKHDHLKDELVDDIETAEVKDHDTILREVAKARREGKSSASFDITKWRRRGRR